MARMNAPWTVERAAAEIEQRLRKLSVLRQPDGDCHRQGGSCLSPFAGRGSTTRFPIVICPTARRQTAPPGLSWPTEQSWGCAAPLQHLNQRALWRDQLA